MHCSGDRTRSSPCSTARSRSVRRTRRCARRSCGPCWARGTATRPHRPSSGGCRRRRGIRSRGASTRANCSTRIARALPTRCSAGRSACSVADAKSRRNLGSFARRWGCGSRRRRRGDRRCAMRRGCCRRRTLPWRRHRRRSARMWSVCCSDGRRRRVRAAWRPHSRSAGGLRAMPGRPCVNSPAATRQRPPGSISPIRPRRWANGRSRAKRWSRHSRCARRARSRSGRRTRACGRGTRGRRWTLPSWRPAGLTRPRWRSA